MKWGFMTSCLAIFLLGALFCWSSGSSNSGGKDDEHGIIVDKYHVGFSKDGGETVFHALQISGWHIATLRTFKDDIETIYHKPDNSMETDWFSIKCVGSELRVQLQPNDSRGPRKICIEMSTFLTGCTLMVSQNSY